MRKRGSAYFEIRKDAHEAAEVGAVFIPVHGRAAERKGKDLLRARGRAVRHDLVDVPGVVGGDDGRGRGLLGFQTVRGRQRRVGVLCWKPSHDPMWHVTTKWNIFRSKVVGLWLVCWLGKRAEAVPTSSYWSGWYMYGFQCGALPVDWRVGSEDRKSRRSAAMKLSPLLTYMAVVGFPSMVEVDHW